MDRIYAALSTWLGPIRGRLMIAFVLVVGMYFVLSFGEQAWRERELQTEVSQRQEEIVELEKKRDELEQQVAEFQTDRYHTYVEQVARRDLSLAYPGETVLLVRWAPPPEPPAEDDAEVEPPEPDPNWRQWLDFLAGLG